MTDAEREFERIAAMVSDVAARVECTPTEYAAGLRTIVAHLSMDLRAAGVETDDHDDRP